LQTPTKTKTRLSKAAVQACHRTCPRLADADCDEVSRHRVRQELRRGCVITSNPAHQVERDGIENINPQQRAIGGAVYSALAVAEFIGFGIGSYHALPDLQDGNGNLAIVVGSRERLEDVRHGMSRHQWPPHQPGPHPALTSDSGGTRRRNSSMTTDGDDCNKEKTPPQLRISGARNSGSDGPSNSRPERQRNCNQKHRRIDRGQICESKIHPRSGGAENQYAHEMERLQMTTSDAAGRRSPYDQLTANRPGMAAVASSGQPVR
jgi:hypothetical protein